MSGGVESLKTRPLPLEALLIGLLQRFSNLLENDTLEENCHTSLIDRLDALYKNLSRLDASMPLAVLCRHQTCTAIPFRAFS